MILRCLRHRAKFLLHDCHRECLPNLNNDLDDVMDICDIIYHKKISRNQSKQVIVTEIN